MDFDKIKVQKAKPEEKKKSKFVFKPGFKKDSKITLPKAEGDRHMYGRFF